MAQFSPSLSTYQIRVFLCRVLLGLRGVDGQSGGKQAHGEVEVKFVRDLPRTRNAKVMRRIIRAAWLGQEAGDVSALENPAAVEEVRRAV